MPLYDMINAAPMVIDLGTEDLSFRNINPIESELAQHIAKYYIYAEKGPSEPTYFDDKALLINTYGEGTFDVNKPYYNHSTAFVTNTNSPMVVERLVPDDIGVKSNFVLWLDVLPTKINTYRRNIDGTIYLDVQGMPEITGAIDGFKVKWVKTYKTDKVTVDDVGLLIPREGSQVDPSNGTKSTMYPIYEAVIKYAGEYGNDLGIRIYANTNDGYTAFPTTILKDAKAYPYNLQFVQRRRYTNSADKIVTTINTQNGNFETTVFSFKPNTVDPLTDANVLQPLLDLNGDYGRISLYQGYTDYLLTMFHEAESNYIETWTDFTSSSLDSYMFNIVSGVNSNRAPYATFQIVDDYNSIRLTKHTNIFAEGSSSGTMNDSIFAELVYDKVIEYANPNSVLMDNAKYPESIIYDTGFPLRTKKALCNFIALRKDTFVHLSTFTSGQRTLTPSEEYSLAVSLKSYLKLFPESDYFGTPVMRGMITASDCELVDHDYKKKVPLSIEVLKKSCDYMGATNGYWKSGKHFDGAPGSIIKYVKNISLTWLPTNIRNTYWSVGINIALNRSTREQFIPALKTVYDDDTSVLNSYFVAMAICYLNKIAHATWREFSGVEYLTNAQLVERVNGFVAAKVKDRFDGRYVIIPNATVTEMDALRGYSWTLPIKIYANNMKTVMTTYVQAYRMEDLQATGV